MVRLADLIIREAGVALLPRNPVPELPREERFNGQLISGGHPLPLGFAPWMPSASKMPSTRLPPAGMRHTRATRRRRVMILGCFVTSSSNVRSIGHSLVNLSFIRRLCGGHHRCADRSLRIARVMIWCAICVDCTRVSDARALTTPVRRRRDD